MKYNKFLFVFLLSLFAMKSWGDTLTQGQELFADMLDCGGWSDNSATCFRLWTGSGESDYTDINGTFLGNSLWFCNVSVEGVIQVQLLRMNTGFSEVWHYTSKFNVENGKDVLKPTEYSMSWTSATWLTSNTIYATPSTLTYTNGASWSPETKTIKANVKNADNPDRYIIRTMSPTGKTYNGKEIYSCKIYCHYNGVHLVQFQIYNGETQEGLKEFDKSSKSWDFNACLTNITNKIFDNNDWVTYGRDFIVYAIPDTTTYGFGEYSFNAETQILKANFKYGSDNSTDWQTVTMTTNGYSFHGKALYAATLFAINNEVRQIQFQVHQNDIWQRQYTYNNNGSDFYPGVDPADLDGKICVGWVTDHHQWDAYATDITLDRQGGTTGSTSVTATVGSAMPAATMPTKDGFTFNGYYTGENGTGDKYYNHDGSSAADWIMDGPTILYADWLPNYTITWIVNGSEYATGSPTVETCERDGIVTLPTAPADNTLSCATANTKFMGWSETDLGGESGQLAPADLFSTIAGAPTINENKIFYAVFAEVPEGMAPKGTVIWSENWTGETHDTKPTSPSLEGSYVYDNASIAYYWMDGKTSSQSSQNSSRVYNTSLAGGLSPEAFIGGKSGGDGFPGYLEVKNIPNWAAKKLTVTYKTNDKRLIVSVERSDYSGGLNDNSSGSHNFDVNCGSSTTFSLKFTAPNSNENVRLDDIVVSVKEDGSYDYRTLCPTLTATPYLVTAATPIFITSAASKMVRSQDSIRIQGSGLTRNGAISLSEPSDKFVLKSAKNGNLTTDADGKIDTIAYIYYTPDASDLTDGLDSYSDFTISVAGNGSKDVVVNQSLIGRHLPTNFVIAARSGETWYALPADMANNDNDSKRAPIVITVDNVTSPTKVLTANVHVYTLYAQHSSFVSAGSGQYIKLAMHGKGNYPLLGSTGNSLGSSTATTITNNIGNQYWWLFEQQSTSVANTTDVKYVVRSANNTKPLTLYNNAEKWGLYASGAKNIQEIRLIPYIAPQLETTVAEWTDDDIQVVAEGAEAVSATQMDAILGNTTTGKAALATPETNTYAANFDGGINFADNEGETLTLRWYNSSDEVVGAEFVTIPRIIATSATSWSSIATTPSDDDIVVLKGEMVVGTNGTAKRVIIDEGSSVEISAGKQLIIAETLRKFDGTSFGATNSTDLIIGSDETNGNGALVMGDHDGTNKARVYFYTKSVGTDRADTSVNQYVGTPFSDANVLYNWYDSWIYKVNDAGTAWERISGSDPMEPFEGYNVIYSKGRDHVYEMDGTLIPTTDKVITLTHTDVGAENVLANSWTAPIKISALAGAFTGADATIYIFNSGSQSQWSTGYGSAAGQYQTIPVNTPTAGYATIPSLQSFSVLAASGATHTLTLDYSAIVYDAAVAGMTIEPNHAPARREVGADMKEAILSIRGESGWSDNVRLYVREDFTEGFDNGYDGRKMYGVDEAPHFYVAADADHLAVAAVPDFEGTVLGLMAGSADNQYTFYFDYDEADALYLLDTDNNTYTRVQTDQTYTFTTSDRAMHNRFILTRNAPQSPTGITETGDGLQVTGVRKVVIDDHVYIIRGGRVYSVEGEAVRIHN